MNKIRIMKCKDCKHCKYIGNTEETRQGLCSAVLSYFPVVIDNQCVFKPKRYKCDDCDRLYNDTACFTCRPEDSAYHKNKLCAGFIDKKEEEAFQLSQYYETFLYEKLNKDLIQLNLDKLIPQNFNSLPSNSTEKSSIWEDLFNKSWTKIKNYQDKN